MVDCKKVVCVIPARLESTRFPRKILANLLNKPLLQWVWEAANNVSFFDNVLFAIDSDITAQVIKSIGAKFVMTSSSCPSGTDRLIEVMKKNIVKGDIWVGWQCDEPFVDESMILSLLGTCESDHASIWTFKKRIKDEMSILSPHVVKVVTDINGYALYFSRSPIPYYQEDSKESYGYFKHIGLYAYTTSALEKISYFSCSPLEKAEKLEQLRFLQNNLPIKVHEVEQDIIGINTLEDLAIAEKYAKQCLSQGMST